MKPDPHMGGQGSYLIRSLYFDTPGDKALAEKLTGVDNREKFRIRFYNHDPSFIRLEKKVKINGLTAKFSAPLTMEQCVSVVNGDIGWLRASEHPLLVELYQKLRHSRLRARTIVDYTREAYAFGPGNVRVTLDTSVRTGLFSTDLFNRNLPTIDALGDGIAILEVKYDAFLPEVIQDILQLSERQKLSVSKYALCRMYG